jgi:MFS family permease
MALPSRPSFLARTARLARGKLFPSLEEGTAPHLSATLAIEGLLSATVLNLATAYTQMFASRMGGTDSQVGLISSLPQLFALLVLIPGALLASRVRNGRRPVEMAIILIGVLYGLAGFSPWVGNFRVWFLIGAVSLANAPVALYNATWQSYFSNIVVPEERNFYYARRTSMTFFAGLIIMQIVGFILGSIQSGATRIFLYQCCYWLTFLISLLQLKVLRRAPKDDNTHIATGWRDLLHAGGEIIKCRKFVVFCLISFFFHAGWYMAWPLFFLIQVHYLGANEIWLGLIAVPANIVQWLTVRPWGRYIEKHGIRSTLVIGSFGLAVNPMLAVLAAVLPQGFGLPAMLVFNLINGFTFSAFQLSILQCMLEAVPVNHRTINISVYTSLLLLANTITPLLGVLLYTALGSDLRAMAMSMAVSSLMRLTAAGFFGLRWYAMRSQADCGQRT